MKEEKTCRFGHHCTSGCFNDYDCPCHADHCCEFTEDCEGDEFCDDHYAPKGSQEAETALQSAKQVKSWNRWGEVETHYGDVFLVGFVLGMVIVEIIITPLI